MRCFVYVVSLSLAACVHADPAEWGTKSTKAKSCYKHAMELLGEGQQGSAENYLDEYVEEYSDSQRILFLRGVLHRSRFSVSTAVTYFKQVAKLDKQTAFGRAAWQSSLLDLGYYKSGENYLNHLRHLKTLKDDHPDEVLLKWLYAIHCRGVDEQAEEAVEAYEEILAVWNPAPVMVHHTYANLLSEELSMHEKALVQRKIALGMTKASWTFQGMANTLSKLERYEEAEPYYAEAAERDPGGANHWSQWGSCLFKLKRYPEALDKHSKASALDPENGYYKTKVADCLMRMGRNGEAIELYKEVLADDPNDKLAELSLKAAQGGGTITRIKNKAGSASFGQDIMDAQNYRLGRNGFNKDYVKALALYKQIYAKHPEAAGQTASTIGTLYMRGGPGLQRDWDLALAWYEKAIAAGHEKANIELITLYLSPEGDVAKAVEYADKSVELFAEDLRCCMMAARAYSSAGQKEKAVEFQTKAIAIVQSANPRMLPSLERTLERYQNQ